MAQLQQVIIEGPDASKPAAGSPGRLYFTTDTWLVYYDNGTSWDSPGPRGNFTNPITTEGDLIIGGSGGTPTRLAAGAAGQVLTAQGAGAEPEWETPADSVAPYDMAMYIAGVFQASETLFELNVVRAFSLPANASGSLARLDAAATNAFSATIWHTPAGGSASNVGSIAFAAGAVTGTFAIAGGLTLAVGDVVSVVAPATADTTAAGMSLTFLGTRS